jgi:hypothetical protein
LTRFVGGFLLLLALLSAGAMAARAQVDQGRALDALEAARELKAAVSAAPSPEAAPRLGDPKIAALFGEALDLSLVAQGIQQPAGIALLFDLQREAGTIIRAYLLAGIRAKSLASDLSGEQAARNFVAFLPELARLYDFRVEAGSAISAGAAMLPGETSDPTVSSAVAAIAVEQEKILLSAIAVASDQQIDPAWRAERVAALGRSAGGYPRLLGKKKAQEVADRALAAAIEEGDANVAAGLKDFALAMLR